MAFEAAWVLTAISAVATVVAIFKAHSYWRTWFSVQSQLDLKSEKIGELENKLQDFELQRKLETQDFGRKLTEIQSLHQMLERDRLELKDSQEKQIKILSEKKRGHWAQHETRVQESLAGLCRRLEINYFDKNSFPLAKRPDFALEIAGQYIVFDAKAPDDPERLTYFPEYLKRQAEAMEKYLKQEGVRKEAYLVAPADALTEIQQKLSYEVNGYQIFVVPPESLESILRLYKKIEQFEFTTQTSPEDKDKIATVIGHSSRLLKRKIQMDQSWSLSSLEFLGSLGQLPDDLSDLAGQKEKTFTVSPPRVERGKEISMPELQKNSIKIDQLLD